MQDVNNATYPGEGEVLLMDKEIHWTSYDVVRKIKIIISNTYNIKKIKVGHAGTLDPLATGLLIVCTGKQTKQIHLYQDLEKEYITKIKLGATTPSFDLETNVDNSFPYEHISEEDVISMLKKLEGLNEQIPPAYSAKRVNGKRAYTYAREGKEIELKPNTVEFYSLELLEFDLPYIKVCIRCSKGTYIRAFARDLGAALNSGGHLVELRRTKIGHYHVENALSIKQFELETTKSA